MTVFSKVSWTKLTGLTVGPIFFILIAYFFLSDQKWLEVVSYRNLARPTVFVPFPALYAVAFLCYFLLILAVLTAAAINRGRYIWEDEKCDFRVGMVKKFNSRATRILTISLGKKNNIIILVDDLQKQYIVNCNLAALPAESIKEKLVQHFSI